MLNLAVFFIFPALVVFAGASDLFTMTIPNRVSILLVAGFVVAGICMGLPLRDWGLHLVGGGTVFAACFAMFSLGWMGGGDAKVASAIALWFGFGENLLAFLLLTAVYGMILTIGLLLFRAWPVLPAALLRMEWLARLHDRKTGIPYGIAISAAALQVYPASFWLDLLS
jgi:prepilin peptidase CpaA